MAVRLGLCGIIHHSLRFGQRRAIFNPVKCFPSVSAARPFTQLHSHRKEEGGSPIKFGHHADTLGDVHPSPSQQLVDEIKGIGSLWGGVPSPALYVGLAGVIPYAATSLCTLYLSWSISKTTEMAKYMAETTHSSIYLMDPQLAQQLLDALQPIQVGYGAVLLSFLGAIHWGLEFAGYGGQQGFRRYFLGILTPALAWPTLLLPTDIALIVQFLGFTGLYYADSKACQYGWTPMWYQNYRFVLTFVVCTALVFTFVVKGWIQESQRAHDRNNLKNIRHEQYLNMKNVTEQNMKKGK